MKRYIGINRITFVLLVMLRALPVAVAQDIQVSQYYNLIHYQNPAFVGSAYAWRAVVHSRLQWPALDSRYTTAFAAVDYNMAKYKSGVGAMLIADQQGSNNIVTYRGIAQYAYQLKLSPRAMLRAGMNAALVNRVLNNAELYYPNQFNGSGFDNSINAPRFTKNYLDLTGGLLLSTDRWWLGLSAAHLNSPNQSFLGGTDKIPVKVDVLAGYKFILKTHATMRYLESEDDEVWTLYPSVLYKYQGKSDQLDFGLYSIYQIFKAGVWYRGLPLKNYNEYLPNNEALIVLAGLKFQNLAFTYSYDITVSGLNQYSNGAHELNLTFFFPNHKKPGYKYKKLPCPDFYGYKAD